jgi:hypothetical protein
VPPRPYSSLRVWVWPLLMPQVWRRQKSCRRCSGVQAITGTKPGDPTGTRPAATTIRCSRHLMPPPTTVQSRTSVGPGRGDRRPGQVRNQVNPDLALAGTDLDPVTHLRSEDMGRHPGAPKGHSRGHRFEPGSGGPGSGHEPAQPPAPDAGAPAPAPDAVTPAAPAPDATASAPDDTAPATTAPSDSAPVTPDDSDG